MKVVLLKDIPGKGRAGQIKEVNNGYARNFLLPRGLASAATAAVVKLVESRMEKERLEESVDRERLLELAQKIEGKEIHLKARAGAGERLFGSVTADDVAEALGQSISSVVDKKKIDMEKPFRRVGSYEVAIRLAGDIKPQITLVIEEEKEEGEQGEKDTEKKAEKKAEEDVEEEQEGAEEEKE